MDRPPPEFAVGRAVRAVLNERNRTPRVGRVRQAVWHFRLARWMFFLEVPGVRVAWRRVPKRYFAADLVAEQPGGVTEPPSPPA